MAEIPSKAQRYPQGLLGTSRDRSGTVRDPSGAGRDSSGAPQEPSGTAWDFSGPLGGRLGPLWGRSGPLWECSGPSGALRYMALIIKGQLKAKAPIFWPFDGKGHKTNWGQLPIRYLYTKFEQNRSINGQDTFKGCYSLCLALDGKGHETN